MVESGGVGGVSSRFKAARVGSTATTIFAEMSALAIATDSVNLGQGFPDYDGPAFMLETAEHAIADGVNQYPPGRGITPLRQAVVDHSSRHYGLTYDADTEVVITTGATEALASAILAFVDPGDEVIALEPFYDSYAASVALAGGRIVGVGVFGPDFTLDLDELHRAVSPRTKMILVNSPHNPTGAVLGRDELSAIAALAIEHDLLVVCDEVYEHLVFDDVEHLPLAAFPGMRERTIRISSSGKTFSATGWKIGWALAPARLITELTAVKQFLTYVSGAPFQPAIARALDEGDEWVAAASRELEGKRDRLATGLRSVGLEPALPRGTYFMTTDVRPLGYADGVEFCRDLPTRCGVVAIPHQVFYARVEAGRPYVRWAFCKSDPVLDEAVRRLSALR
ncbi:MAG TPA: pyridoxal phosphate-dependent aminotransferase [Microlunatus sp.]|nr:pyridoxal phosphate-dependent aminotransferase [Microlunatus sp.]